MIFENKKDEIRYYCQTSIRMLNEIMKMIEKEKLQDEQFVLDWLDKINEISVRF